MNKFKFDAAIKEFPFLRTCLLTSGEEMRDFATCDGITVRRMTSEFLNTVPRDYSVSGSMVNIKEWERVDFVMSDGGLLKDAVRADSESVSHYAYEGTSRSKGETILEAIDRMRCADRLAFIVMLEGGYEVENHFSTSAWCCTVYKPLKGQSIQSVIDAAFDAALAEVRAESAF